VARIAAVSRDMATPMVTTSFPADLEVAPFTRPIQDTYAFIWRKDHTLSPATAELIAMARQLMSGYGPAPVSD
jgi:hypothetical protein